MSRRSLSLILMRHAKSDSRSHSGSDWQRPLNERGRQAAHCMAKHLQSQGVEVDVILASTAVRVQQTLAEMREVCDLTANELHEEELYLAGPYDIKRHLEGLDDAWRTVLLIGHNPGLSHFASQLADMPLQLPTAAVAYFESIDVDSWVGSCTADQWQLKAVWKPGDLE